jgi:Uma2 family endonuclease
MEALKRYTVADLLAEPDERVELIDGEIVRRPMARGEHGMAQGAAREELGTFNRKSGPGGWWIATEISVAYWAVDASGSLIPRAGSLTRQRGMSS